MKRIKSYESFNENKSSIKELCNLYYIENYVINSDGSIDVNGNVDLSIKGLTQLPLTFNKVSGWFYCGDNRLTSLKGAPKYVGDNFSCGGNMLTTLEYSPKYIGGRFYCSGNKLTSLEGCTESVGYFSCCDNELTSLVGGPKEVKDSYNCSNNKLTSLEGAPLSLITHLYCDHNPIHKYWKSEYYKNMEIYLYMDINSNDPEEINRQKMSYIDSIINSNI